LVERDGGGMALRLDKPPEHDPVGVSVRSGRSVEHPARGGDVAKRGVAAEQLGAGAEVAEEAATEKARVEGAQGRERAA
jgi:hypothetical protein